MESYSLVDPFAVYIDGSRELINDWDAGPYDIRAQTLTAVGALTGTILELPTTTSTTGQIQQNSVRVFHTYGTSNLFIGEESGNYTATGIGGNVGLGAESLKTITTGYLNMAIGARAGIRLTEGIGNVLIGTSAGEWISTGSSNMLIGRSAGSLLTTGGNNVGIGYYSLANITGSGTVAIGSRAGLTVEANGGGIFIGNSAGRHNTLANILIFDNQDRSDAATEITNAIIYGTMAAAPANQTLRLNAKVGIGKTPTVDLDVTGALAVSTTGVFGGEITVGGDGTDAQINFDGDDGIDGTLIWDGFVDSWAMNSGLELGGGVGALICGTILAAGGDFYVDNNGNINTGSGDLWDLNDYTADADHVAAGYITVTINSTSYRLLTYLTP